MMSVVWMVILACILGPERREVVRNTPVHVESTLVPVYDNRWVRFGVEGDTRP